MRLIDWRGDKYLNPKWVGHTRPQSKITRIMVHHDATWIPPIYSDKNRIYSEARYHYQQLGPGLQYHFSIANDGTIYWVRPFETWLYHAGDSKFNTEAVAVCLHGNFEKQNPTKQQIRALKELLDWLCTKNPQFPAAQKDVYGHREIRSTLCPGKNLIGWVKNYRIKRGKI